MFSRPGSRERILVFQLAAKAWHRRLSIAICLLLLSQCFFGFAQDVILDNLDAAYYLRQGSGGVVILMYHGLDAPFGYDPAKFVAQIQYLADNNYHTITLDHLRSWILTGLPLLPDKPIVLTFDDNYLSVYTVAFPTLQARGFIGYNFAHTYYVGVVTSFDHADWNEIQEMEDAGVIFTESHTVMHVNLTAQSESRIWEELVNSKLAIETNLSGKVCRHLAYPYGAYNTTVIHLTQASGYETAVTTISGVNTRSTPLYELRRYNVTPNTTLGEFASIVGNAAGEQQPTDWTHSTAVSNYYGADYQYAPPGSGNQVAVWNVVLPSSGDYRVSTWYTAHANRATNAPYIIQHQHGETWVRVNQTVNGSSWVSLGIFSFVAGQPYSITISNDADGYVIADAIRLEPQGLTVPSWSLY